MYNNFKLLQSGIHFFIYRFIVNLLTVIMSDILMTWTDVFLNITGKKENLLMLVSPGYSFILNNTAPKRKQWRERS
jgi:hypothetical protein